MKRAEIVFIPAMGISHLVSALHFAKCLVDRHNHISITILVIKAPFIASMDSYINSFSSSQPKINLTFLPQMDLPPPNAMSSPENFITLFIESHIPHVRDILMNKISPTSNSDSQVVGLVLDLFCLSMVDLAAELGIPSYFFLTSNAGFLGFMLHLPTRHRQIQMEFQDSDPPLMLRSFVHPVPTQVLPSAAFDKDGYSTYLKLAEGIRKTRGIMVNTFFDLEFHALNSFPDCEIPPVYAVGPLLDLNSEAHPDVDQVQRDKILKWLDDQPESSVVFLCFGTMGSLGAAQLEQMAVGLERSGFRFLWSIRFPREDKIPRLEDMLPEDFMERTEGKSMICGWAPQASVLAHKSIGGFVSHCGWNSILESLWYGVPIATWPLYAEQQINAFMMVKELGLAVELRLDSRMGGGDVVLAEEIERAVRCLMDGASEVRKKVKELGKIGRKAMMHGGSSFMSTGQLLDDMISNC